MASNDPANLPRIPHHEWARGIPELPPGVARQEEANWEEYERWSVDMLAKGWPGSGGIRSGYNSSSLVGSAGGQFSSGGGALAAVAVGVTASSGVLVANLATTAALGGFTNPFTCAVIEFDFTVAPLTATPGMMNVIIGIEQYATVPAYTGNYTTIPMTIMAANVGDIYPIRACYHVPVVDVNGTAVASPGMGVRMTVVGASAQACTLTYAYRVRF